MVKAQIKNYDDYERIRYFYYVRPQQRVDWWFDPMAPPTTTSDSVTTLSASEEATLLLYDIFIPLLGSVIILLNLIVVVSCVLLLRKGQQPYTTYMFLGNVAVSDLLTGFAVIYGQYAPYELRGEDNCALMIGLIVSASLVSVYSVGLIALDRYLYIVYGLQYQRYLTRTRARLLITTTWLIGAVIGFLPAFGWRGDTDQGRTCWFIRLAPPPLVILTSVAGFLPVLLVIILYSIILRKALRRVSQLKKASRELRGVQTGNLRLFRGGGGASAAATTTGSLSVIPTTATTGTTGTTPRPTASHSDNEQGASEDERLRPAERAGLGCLCFRWPRCGCSCGSRRGAKRSKSALNEANDEGNNGQPPVATTTATRSSSSSIRGPTKWKAVKVVMFTTGSFVVTWVPYFIASIMFVACDPVTQEELCRGLQFAIASPLAILGFANSLLNPIVYAWWHNGFRESMKKLGGRLSERLCCGCGEKEDGTRIGCCGGRCCRESSRNATRTAAAAAAAGAAASISMATTDTSVNRISITDAAATTGIERPLSSETRQIPAATGNVTNGRALQNGRRQRATVPSSSSDDQEFSVTDDTDLEQPVVAKVTRL
ncbi:5-hydroxytryptamine receptor 1A-like [Anopheles aquasalis]|uniref:5-hydroxytryptamine receptor 1A-like n=1 Tax=Anopheles aquasalis TaxID=42839 RepID=UPI00215B72A6|nr:5-hydroxytryptamine receptor 1A-like [Anopheles aquasalis]XP_050081757.1 5-hydroxytryptamine receptor 1A-like [Anopheles aquasalis]XP_050081758.1 5-hydroxytryptamine receptor 1A-like [Anopheles aquasalis]